MSARAQVLCGPRAAIVGRPAAQRSQRRAQVSSAMSRWPRICFIRECQGAAARGGHSRTEQHYRNQPPSPCLAVPCSSHHRPQVCHFRVSSDVTRKADLDLFHCVDLATDALNIEAEDAQRDLWSHLHKYVAPHAQAQIGSMFIGPGDQEQMLKEAFFGNFKCMVEEINDVTSERRARWDGRPSGGLDDPMCLVSVGCGGLGDPTCLASVGCGGQDGPGNAQRVRGTPFRLARSCRLRGSGRHHPAYVRVLQRAG